jgi:hypothetical protein
VVLLLPCCLWRLSAAVGGGTCNLTCALLEAYLICMPCRAQPGLFKRRLTAAMARIVCSAVALSTGHKQLVAVDVNSARQLVAQRAVMGCVRQRPACSWRVAAGRYPSLWPCGSPPPTRPGSRASCNPASLRWDT